MQEIELYTSPDNQIELQVNLENETVWLTQKQMGSLFERDTDTIGLHVKNIYNEVELDEKATTEFFSVVQIEGGREVKRKLKFYNLDAIISIGYRVNSKRGTQFRQWATQRLKDYLVKGYSINQKRLKELQKTIQLISQSTDTQDLKLNEAKGLLDILSSYTQSFILLNQYDHNSFSPGQLNENITYEITYQEAKSAIQELKHQLFDKKEATGLFGNEKDQNFAGTFLSIIQTFDGKYVYSSIEEQAANLLYLIIKNHPFSDGNKRIGAFLFVWFLEKNKHRFKKNGELKINDNGLVALALLVAQSNPAEKDLMIKLIINLINTRT